MGEPRREENSISTSEVQELKEAAILALLARHCRPQPRKLVLAIANNKKSSTRMPFHLHRYPLRPRQHQKQHFRRSSRNPRRARPTTQRRTRRLRLCHLQRPLKWSTRTKQISSSVSTLPTATPNTKKTTSTPASASARFPGSGMPRMQPSERLRRHRIAQPRMQQLRQTWGRPIQHATVCSDTRATRRNQFAVCARTKNLQSIMLLHAAHALIKKLMQNGNVRHLQKPRHIDPSVRWRQQLPPVRRQQCQINMVHDICCR